MAATQQHETRPCGMTLMEIMIVVLLLGILAAMVVPTLVHARGNTQVTATASDMKNMAAALERYRADHGDYPAHVGYRQIPNELYDYFPLKGYTETPLGGTWDYVNYVPAQSTISGQQFSVAVRARFDTQHFIEIDRLIDDGDLSTGAVQQFNAHGVSLVYIVKRE